MAVRVSTSKLSSGSGSGVFGMDIERDIAYPIRLVLEKETGIFSAEEAVAFPSTWPTRYMRLLSPAAAANAFGR
jgi:hypothetical protein